MRVFGFSTITAAALLLFGCGQSDETPEESDDSAPSGGSDTGGGSGGSTAGGDGDPSSGGQSSTPTPTTSAASCSERSDSLPTRNGATHVVSPLPDGQVSLNGAPTTLRSVVRQAESGDTILLEDGTYTFAEAGADEYTGLYFTKPDVTLRGASGDASAVILDSAYLNHGEQTAPISVDASGIVLADFTVQRSIFHLIHLWKDGDGAIIHNVRLIDGGQQFLKASPGDSDYVDDALVSCSQFLMTADGRDNVWGYGDQDGWTTCYTGGIDTHNARGWSVVHNVFDGIYCDESGPQRPAHGEKSSDRGNQTYQGGLAEHAIHMWESPEGAGHLIDANLIKNCARGIGIGLRDEVYDSQISNNMIFSEFAGSREHDVGIIVERGHDILIAHNTVFFSSPDAYPSSIEVRFDSTSNVSVVNNLTGGNIRERDGATTEQAANETASPELFVDATAGDLHLASCEAPPLFGPAAPTAIETDLDGDARGEEPHIGADQCVE